MGAATTAPSEWVLYKVHNDPKAREQIILKHISLVKYIADRVRDNLPPEVDKEDLVSYGIFGLMDAIEKFDPSRCIKFETYAIPRIRGAILDGLRSVDTAPRSIRHKAKMIGKAYAEVESRLGRVASDQEIAEHLNMDMPTYNSTLAEVSRLPLLSLDEMVIQDDDGSVTLGERIENKTSNNPVELLEIGELRDSLMNGIDSLTKQERLVITLYYYEGLTLKETSEVLGLSESRISQVRAKAVIKLRDKMSHFLIDG